MHNDGFRIPSGENENFFNYDAKNLERLANSIPVLVKSEEKTTRQKQKELEYYKKNFREQCFGSFSIFKAGTIA